MLPNGYPHMSHQLQTLMQIGWTHCLKTSRGVLYRDYSTRTLAQTSFCFRILTITHRLNWIESLPFMPPSTKVMKTNTRRVPGGISALSRTTVTPTGKAAMTAIAAVLSQRSHHGSPRFLYQSSSPWYQREGRHCGSSYPTLPPLNQAAFHPGGKTTNFLSWTASFSTGTNVIPWILRTGLGCLRIP